MNGSVYRLTEAYVHKDAGRHGILNSEIHDYIDPACPSHMLIEPARTFTHASHGPHDHVRASSQRKVKPEQNIQGDDFNGKGER
jgi:hypothetical protein